MHNCHPNTAQVLSALDRGERRLFHDRVRHLDRRILPGVSKLSWAAPKPALDFFFHEAAKCDMFSDLCAGGLLRTKGYVYVVHMEVQNAQRPGIWGMRAIRACLRSS